MAVPGQFYGHAVIDGTSDAVGRLGDEFVRAINGQNVGISRR